MTKEYFLWLYDIAMKNRSNYKELCWYLFDTVFYFSNPYDSNRASDGIDLRYRFSDERGYSQNQIEATIDNQPCSMLEMMVGLALRCDETIMQDARHAGRTNTWFWNMLKSLHLDKMTDENFNIEYCHNVLQRLFNKDYEPNGAGGLFTVHSKNIDMRELEYWYQAMRYFNEILEGER